MTIKLSIITIAIWCIAFTAKAQFAWEEVYNGNYIHYKYSFGSAGNGAVYAIASQLSGNPPIMLRSNADGAPGTWQQVQLPQIQQSKSFIDGAANGADVYLTSNYAYWRSGDYGNSWQSMSGLPVPVFSSTDFHFLPYGNVILSMIDTQMYRSIDHGQTWVKVLGWKSWLDGDWLPGHGAAVIQKAGDTYAFIDREVYKSTDLGINWTKLNAAMPAGIPYSVVLLSTDSFLTVNDKGVYISADAVTWSKKTSTGYTAKPNFIVDMVKLWKSDSLVLLRYDTSYTGEMLCSPDGGNNWVKFETGIPDTISPNISDLYAWNLFLSDRGYIFTSGYWGEIYRTRKQSSLSVDETVNTIDGVNIYPNPVSDKLIIENLVTKTRLVLLNMFGQQVYDEIVNAGVAEVNTSQLPAGNYILQITEPNGKRNVRKVLKQ